MNFDAVGYLKEQMEASAFLKDVNTEPDTSSYIPLTDDQMSTLETLGNLCDDWSQIKVKENTDITRIRGCLLSGGVYIGSLEKGNIFHCRLKNVFIEDEAVLQHSNIKDCIIKEEASVKDCHEVSCSGSTMFGNGIELPVAIEVGGREIRIYAELNIPSAARIAGNRTDKAHIEEYSTVLDEYCKKASSKRSYIGKKAKVVDTKVIDSYIGDFACIDNATIIQNSTVLSNEEEVTEVSHGAFVTSSLIQWGCEVTSMAIVTSSLLNEHSHVAKHGMVTESIVGPNSGVEEGEVTASLLGPFVGFHHQALLIAAFWPEGKGNIAYGANVGSNHPSRAPDQEIWPGEGLFIGLGAHIKFPSNFTKAPYTIIASGVTTLSERVEYPFSLINVPAHTFDGISPAYNEIFPGWVLSDNLFMIKRNEGKYQKRNKARRSTFVFEVFRPDIVNLMIEARSRLQSNEGQKLYLRDDIDGLGKNYLLEEKRIKGIETYTFYIGYYALSGLKKKLEKEGVSEDILEKETDDKRWEHERRIISAEYSDTSVRELLEKLSVSQKKIAEAVEATKEKDDVRGRRIISDYDQVHEHASENSFVQQVWKETEVILKEIESLLKTV